MTPSKREAAIDVVAYSCALIVILVVFGSCAEISVSCWHRGGTVLRNAFDWPTCVEVVKR